MASRLELAFRFGYCFIRRTLTTFPASVVDRHEDMRRSPVVALLLSFSFLLQLALARDGTTCVMAGSEHHGMAMAMAAAPAVDMSAMHMPLGVATDPTSPDSCDHESAASACLVMAPCASGFMTISASVADDASALPERIAAATIVMPASRTIPPELPPPRA